MLTNLAPHSASSSALCRGSAAPDADTRDKPEHDARGGASTPPSPTPPPSAFHRRCDRKSLRRDAFGRRSVCRRDRPACGRP
ncbi:hypothetical protein EFB14_13060 [Rhizobium fabae]|uniref:Uncharacterized protein n=1 Tax=Rhizobium fabae TaxID=573179 RepID=A0ABY0BAU6_9HYPH|nr:hypothetical protein EFB14_13060 [Rhizobium fabae]